MKTRVEITEHGVVFSSELAKAVFLERFKGQPAYLVIDDQPTANMRRYFEGAVVPAVFYQHPKSGWVDFGECREVLKLEFLGGVVHRIDGSVYEVAKSTSTLSKGQFRAFLDHVTMWLIDTGLECPDPDDYKAWRDSAPEAGQTYPPLLRLKQKYELCLE